MGVVDAKGEPLPGLSPSDLVVEEGGERREVLEVRPEGRDWRVVVYLDSGLAGARTLAQASRALETLARELTELGEVEVVLAADGPRLLLPASRDPLAVSAVLARADVMERGEDRLVELRREALDEMKRAETDDERRAVAVDAARREAAFVEQRLDELLAWAAARGGADPGAPGLLLWVGDGFDLEPARFWRGRPGLAELPEQGAALADTHAATARALAALGWTVVPVSLRRGEADDPSRFGAGTYEDLSSGETRIGGSIRIGRKTPEQRAEEALAREAGPPPLPLAPAEPLARLAEESGGRRVDAVDQLAGLLAELGARFRVRFASRSGGGDAVDEAVRPLRVALAAADGLTDDERDGRGQEQIGEGREKGRSGAGGGNDAATETAVAAPRWIGRGTPPAVSALRARRLLAGDLDPGEVTVRAALAVGLGEGGAVAGAVRRGEPPRVELPGATTRVGAEDPEAATGSGPPAAGPPPVRATLEVRVEPPPGAGSGGIEALTAGPRRLTLAALGAEGGPPVVRHRVVGGELVESEVPPEEGAPVRLRPPPSWLWRGEVDLPAGTERVAVVIEEAGGRRWGGTVAGIFDAARSAAGGAGGGWDVAAGLLPGPKPVNLLRPRGDVLTGRVRFQAITEPTVERVVFHVDGRRRDTVRRPPWLSVLDFGRLPVPRRVEAVGYAADGSEVGRDELLLNTGGGRLRVRITDPEGPRATGAVDVALAVQVPDGETLDRVDLYWRDRLAATLFQPPFRHRLRIPRDDAEGFLRAVVRLADGAQTEDVLYLNGPLAAERVEVDLHELYVVVEDGDGRPVRGLTAEDFVVREDGEVQRVETFSDAGDLPITVGLAIDSSASMFVKLPEVQAAAEEFLAGLEAGRDRAFLVDFDDQVRLAAAPSRDLPAVRASGGGLVADGRTSLWKAIVYSLVQIQGVPGRKALIVYSDGADEDEDFPYRNALDFARKVGVPIYVIVSNDEAVRTGGIPIGFPSLGRRLRRLTEEVGGRVWLVRRGDDLGEIYRRIQEELSAQYLLGYYPDGGGWSDWRRVGVEVRRRGLRARTLTGYER